MKSAPVKQAIAALQRSLTCELADWPRYPAPVQLRLSPGFFDKVDPSGGTWACWPWTGSQAAGYGTTRVWRGGRSIVAGAHRVYYWVQTGFWREGNRGMVVRHLCHNRLCCNPRHLLAGTRADNVWDNQMRDAGVDLVAIRRELEGQGPFLPVVGVAA